MVVRIVRTLLFVFRAHDEVAARDCLEEVGHIVTASRHHHFAIVYFILSHRLNSDLLHHLRHSAIVCAWWAAIEDIYVTSGAHRAGNPVGHLSNAAYQLLTVLFT